jgi:flagella basal body P-ring formation protein FlgA
MASIVSDFSTSRRKRPAASLIFLILLNTVLLAGQGTIRLKESTVVTKAVITLGQVAEIQVSDPKLHSRLLTLELARQDTAFMSIPLIEQSLEQAGIASACLDIFGASRCLITRELKPADTDAKTFQTNTLPSLEEKGQPDDLIPLEKERKQADTLVDALTRELARLSRMDPDRLHVQWECRSARDLLKREFTEGRFEFTPRSAMTLGNVFLDVVDTTDPPFKDKYGKSHTRRYPVRGKVQYLCESIVAARQLHPGEVIRAKDLKRLSRRVDDLRDVGLTDVQQAVGLETARLIPEGALINARLLKKLILIERNDDVNVSYNDGRIAVQFRGKAKQTGGLGDTIEVQDLSNKSVIQGRITGSGQVSVGDWQDNETKSSENIISDNSTIPKGNGVG